MYHLTQEIKQHYLTLAVILCVFLGTSFVFEMTNGLEWASMNPSYVMQGELWRLVTAHLAHLDKNHFFMNMLGLSMCMIVFRDDVRAVHWIAGFLFVATFSSLMMIVNPLLHNRYVGFSDVLHGWILIGAASIAHREPKLTLIIFILFGSKVIEENMSVPFFTTHGVEDTVAYESHIYGAIGGVLYSFFFVKHFRDTTLDLFKTKGPNLTA